MEPPSGDEMREDIARMIDMKVKAGFRARDEILAEVEDFVEDLSAKDPRDHEPLQVFAAQTLAAAWRRQRADEATWVGRTDCDRLDQAFAELESVGIVARQDFSCCGTCGVSEIGGEAEALEARGIKVRGYTFYHMQDTEAATQGLGLFLNFGDAEGSKEAALEIGREIFAVLQSHGLAPQWDGSLARRIQAPLVWRRRFHCS